MYNFVALDTNECILHMRATLAPRYIEPFDRQFRFYIWFCVRFAVRWMFACRMKNAFSRHSKRLCMPIWTSGKNRFEFTFDGSSTSNWNRHSIESGWIPIVSEAKRGFFTQFVQSHVCKTLESCPHSSPTTHRKPEMDHKMTEK